MKKDTFMSIFTEPRFFEYANCAARERRPPRPEEVLVFKDYCSDSQNTNPTFINGSLSYELGAETTIEVF